MYLSSNPIKKGTLSLFKGRKKLLKKIEKHLSLFDIVLLEGKFGVGKTSLGNYYRVKSNVLTLEIEISTNVNWSIEEFLHVVLKNLLKSIEKSDIYSSLAVTDLYKKLDKRYRTVVKEIQGGAIGINLGVGNSSSRTNIRTQAELISDLNELSILCKRKSEIEKSVIIQLNNLDIIEDNSEGVFSFFNSIRNVFLTDGKNKDEYGNHLPNPDYLYHSKICTNNIEKLKGSVIKLLKTKYKELYYEELFN